MLIFVGNFAAHQCQWLFLVPLKGGRWHIIPQLAVYTTYILPSFGGYMLPTTLYRNLKNSLTLCPHHFQIIKFSRSPHLLRLFGLRETAAAPRAASSCCRFNKSSCVFNTPKSSPSALWRIQASKSCKLS